MPKDLLAVVNLLASSCATREMMRAGIEAYCALKSVTRGEAELAIAKSIALEFVRGEMAYAQADQLMNVLVNLDTEYFDHTGLAWQLYLQFDRGEYRSAREPVNAIPWQSYTCQVSWPCYRQIKSQFFPKPSLIRRKKAASK